MGFASDVVVRKKLIKFRSRVLSGFFITIMLFSAFEFAFLAAWTARVQAASQTVPALNTASQQPVKLESQGVGTANSKDDSSTTKDPSIFKTDVFEEKELVNERDRFKEVRQNKDGSKTQKNYLTPQFFQKDGAWQAIDETLVEDTNATDGGLASSLIGKVQSVFKGEANFKVKENDWQVKFAATNDQIGMLRIQQGGQTVTFRPVGAKAVPPSIRWVEGKQYVNYYDIWPGVSLEYIVGTAQVKLNVVLKDKDATNNIGFTIDGATLEIDPNARGVYRIKGAFSDQFSVLPVNLIRNKYGFETKEVYKQEFKEGQLRIWANKDYLQSLPTDAFPVVIDPTTQNSSFGTRASGNYVSLKSDGYVCPSTTCNPYAGSLVDTNYTWQAWRGAIHSPYQAIMTNRDFVSANLHLVQRTGASFWTGNYSPRTFYAYHATCLNNFNCVAGPGSSSYFGAGTSGDINVTELFRQRIAAGDWGAWVMILGEEGAVESYKNFDPDQSYISFTHAAKPPSTVAVYPADKKVLVTDQPQLAVNQLTPPAGETYKYYFRVATNTDAETGTVFNSGDIDSTTWTLPEGVLQDGQTYYWKVYTRNWVNGGLVGTTQSSWIRSFKYDARSGKDPTQSYDAAGPISVGQATGNTTTSAASHGMSALGGNIGIGLEYNSPVMSKQGLLAEYYGNNNFSGNPVITRVEQKIDHNWSVGSPASGIIGNDNFSSKFTGYFIAPKDGNYKFGGSNDDSMQVFLNNSTTPSYTNGGCYSGVCMGTASVALTAGQVVPVRVQHVEATGPAYAKAYVKIDSEAEQIIPSEWLRTPLRQTSPTTGLRASYFDDAAGTHIVPTSTSTAFASRIEPKVTFNYGSSSPVPTGKTDAFMASHDGYITVPTSGNYQFGTIADDAAKVWVDGQVVVDDWVQDGLVTAKWGTSIWLDAGASVPIRVHYYELTGGASLKLNVRGAVTEQEVPATWLSSKVQVLPTGWQLGLDADGDLGYDYAKITSQNVILYDASGTSHEYKYDAVKKSYTAPINEYGVLVRNSDGSVTLQDEDGRSYIFNSDGRLREVATVTDDRNPAALKYEYSGMPPRLSKIVDGVDPSRYGSLYYKGDAECSASPATFDASPPDNMLCAFVTTDGDRTDLFYKSGQLARIQLPGNEVTDIGYDGSGRIVQHRSSLANDAVLAGVRDNDAGITTELSYDDVGRIRTLTEPAPNAGEGRATTEYDYLPTTATGTPTVVGYSQVRELGSSMPNGFTKRVEFDATYRTIKDIDKANLASTTEWHATKDLTMSNTTATGLKSTTIYDTVGNDRPVSSYGPAPAAWYDSWNYHPNHELKHRCLYA